MAYKYVTANRAITANSPKQTYRNNFQAFVNEQFYNSSDWYEIEEESPFASAEYYSLDARINTVVQNETGFLQRDDYRTLLFKDIEHTSQLGWMYRFDNNYWIAVNATILSSLNSSVTIRRCNNVLRWIDTDGGFYEEPCALEFIIKENRDYSTAGSAMVTPSGFMEVIVQLNSRTNTIKPNQRFLFGNADNWTAYRVFGDGINNHDNLETIDNLSWGFLRLTIGADYVNEQTDDVVNGIADAFTKEYLLTLNPDAIQGVAAQTNQLNESVTLNGETVDRTVEWSSSDSAVATVSASGLVTLVAIGECTITCQLENNTSVYDTCDIEVVAGPVSEYVVVIDPEQNYVLEGESQAYDVILYLNGVAQADAFVFTLDPGDVPSASYDYNVSGDNAFIITNYKKYSGDVLSIECVSGIHTRTIEIALRGAW